MYIHGIVVSRRLKGALCSIVHFHCALHCARYGRSAQHFVHNAHSTYLHNEACTMQNPCAPCVAQWPSRHRRSKVCVAQSFSHCAHFYCYAFFQHQTQWDFFLYNIVRFLKGLHEAICGTETIWYQLE